MSSGAVIVVLIKYQPKVSEILNYRDRKDNVSRKACPESIAGAKGAKSGKLNKNGLFTGDNEDNRDE
jgi:hypothetical protein